MGTRRAAEMPDCQRLPAQAAPSDARAIEERGEPIAIPRTAAELHNLSRAGTARIKPESCAV